MYLEDLKAPFDIGQGHVDLPVKSTGAGQGRIEHVHAVGSSADDDLIIGLKAVHLHENGIEGLLALVVAAGTEPRAAPAPDGVDFVEEYDAGAVILGLFEQVSNARSADADKHLNKVRAGDGEKRHFGLAGDGLGEHGLAGTGVAHEQHAAGDAPAEALELLGIAQELDDLLDLVLGLFNAGDVVEGDVGVLFGGNLVLGPAKVAEHAARA